MISLSSLLQHKIKKQPQVTLWQEANKDILKGNTKCIFPQTVQMFNNGILLLIFYVLLQSDRNFSREINIPKNEL